MTTSITGKKIFIINSSSSSYCPEINNETPSPKQVRPSNYNNYEVYSCTYSDSILNELSKNDITTWKNEFIFEYGNDPIEALDILNNQLLPAYCFETIAQGCPKNPLDINTSLTTCSRFLDTTDNTCRIWASQNKDKADELYRSYCNDNYNEITGEFPIECKCILKEKDPSYITLLGNDTENQLGPPACWYVPCSNGTFYLLTQDDIQKEPCKDTCGVIFNNYQESDYKPPQEFVNCNFNNPPKKDISFYNTDNNNNNNNLYTYGLPIMLALLSIAALTGIIILIVIGAKKGGTHL